MAEPSSSALRVRRPRIGITAWRRPLPTPLGAATDLYTLGCEYADAVQTAGGLALILPHGDDVDAVLDGLDGLVLSGGGDLDPRSYGEQPASVKDARLEADRWEIALARGAADRELPVLGICRGMQVLAVAHGGRLAPDIAGRDGHPEMADLTSDEILSTRHAVSIVPTSVLCRIYGTTTRAVNTIHHQAVSDPGDLDVSASAADGLIEAVEGRGAGWLVGVQWHPEKLPAAEGAAEQPLFAQIVGEARAYAARRQANEV